MLPSATQSGECSTNPRVSSTGPPDPTRISRFGGLGSTPSCTSNSANFGLFTGRFNSTPIAPSAECAQTKITLCAKRGSPIEGIAISNCPVSQSASRNLSFSVFAMTPTIFSPPRARQPRFLPTLHEFRHFV